MTQFDVYSIAGDGTLLIELQSDLIDIRQSRVFAPLISENLAEFPRSRLHPLFEIEGERYLMATHLMGSFPTRDLPQPIDNMSGSFAEISNALDMLFHGF
ncbi:CcdB family protein [Minwuia sp.]|uniref:CcdB family protein n=1 Tax=Minwuia sp. TaxID=2493630 RepID=UPI003A8FE868